MNLSSHTTFFWKFIFPGIWIFGLISGVIEVAGRGITFDDPVFALKALVGAIFIGLGIGISVKFLDSLKSVYLEGDSLLISNYYRKIRLPLTEIAVVNGPDRTSHSRISLYLNSPTIFGDEMWFMLPLFLARSTADLLRRRVESVENVQKERVSKTPEDARKQ